jgi:predicted RNA-binding protein Jag
MTIGLKRPPLTNSYHIRKDIFDLAGCTGEVLKCLQIFLKQYLSIRMNSEFLINSIKVRICKNKKKYCECSKTNNLIFTSSC